MTRIHVFVSLITNFISFIQKKIFNQDEGKIECVVGNREMGVFGRARQPRLIWFHFWRRDLRYLFVSGSWYCQIQTTWLIMFFGIKNIKRQWDPGRKTSWKYRSALVRAAYSPLFQSFQWVRLGLEGRARRLESSLAAALGPLAYSSRSARPPSL